MKKILSLLLVCFLLVSLAVVTVSAEDGMFVIEPKPISVTYNGDDIQFPDALPLIQNGRTLVPVRAIMERASLTVDYEPASRTVTAQKNDLTIVMSIDSAEATVTRGDAVQQVTLEEPARLIDGRTYVPIRFLGESMDVKVNWNANGREVVLIDPSEWKQKIAQNAAMLNCMLDLPLQQKPYFSDTAGDIQVEYLLKNLPTDSGFSEPEISCDFYVSLSETEVFDGTNTGTYLVTQIDLSSLKKLPADFLGMDDETLLELAKMHRIDIDMVKDSASVLYIKSMSLAEKLSELGIADLKDAIGNHYVKFSNSNQTSSAEATTPPATVWDAIVNFIESDNLLYSQSVAHISQLVDAYIAAFHNNRCDARTSSNGVTRHECTLTEKELATLSLDVTNASHDADISRAALKMIITESAGVISKMEIALSLSSDVVPLDNAEGAKQPTMQYNITLNIGTAFRDYSSTYDRKVSIPKNVIAMEELEKQFEN